MLSIVAGTVLMVGLTILKIKNSKNISYSNYDTLVNQGFVFVQDPKKVAAYDKNYGVAFDFKNKNVFYTRKVAIKNKVKYGNFGTNKSHEVFERLEQTELSSVMFNLKISKDDIRKSNYVIESEVKSLINKSYLEEEYPPSFEAVYRIKEREFTKIRVTYNKEYLPTKIEWYYRGDEGLKWYTWRTYSYPLKTKADFDKELDKQIEIIKEIEREKEEE